MPWMVIYPLGDGFSYHPGDHFKGSRWIIVNLIDAVAKGGNFMPAIGPDGNGRFDPEAVREFEQAGRWLQVNGEAIYATRPREGTRWQEGDDVRFTRSKDRRTIYAICLRWPGAALKLSTVRPAPGSAVSMLGVGQPLAWRYDRSAGLVIDLPERLQPEANRPCREAWTFRIEAADAAGEWHALSAAQGRRFVDRCLLRTHALSKRRCLTRRQTEVTRQCNADRGAFHAPYRWARRGIDLEHPRGLLGFLRAAPLPARLEPQRPRPAQIIGRRRHTRAARCAASRARSAPSASSCPWSRGKEIRSKGAGPAAECRCAYGPPRCRSIRRSPAWPRPES